MAVNSDLRFTFTAGPDVFDVVEFHLSEGLSETFRLEVDLSSTNRAVDFGQVLDRPALLTIWQGAKARAGHPLLSQFTKCPDSFWKRIYADLPRAEDYS